MFVNRQCRQPCHIAARRISQSREWRLKMIKIPLNQQIAERMDISPDGMYAGVELKQHRPERFEMVSVKDLTGLDDTEGGFWRRLNSSAGIGWAECRGGTVAVTGIRSRPDREYGSIIKIIRLFNSVLVNGSDHRFLESFLGNIISRTNAAKNTGQEQRHYEHDSFHDINKSKYRNLYRIFSSWNSARKKQVGENLSKKSQSISSQYFGS